MDNVELVQVLNTSKYLMQKITCLLLFNSE
jgi:hypothetical protein